MKRLEVKVFEITCKPRTLDSDKNRHCILIKFIIIGFFSSGCLPHLSNVTYCFVTNPSFSNSIPFIYSYKVEKRIFLCERL